MKHFTTVTRAVFRPHEKERLHFLPPDDVFVVPVSVTTDHEIRGILLVSLGGMITPGTRDPRTSTLRHFERYMNAENGGAILDGLDAVEGGDVLFLDVHNATPLAFAALIYLMWGKR